MPYSTAGLPNNGRTQYFNFQYDDKLTPSRGKDLATEVMQTADADLAILAGWFSGRQLDMSPPINVSINNVGNPTDAGGHWMGALLVPLQVMINIGELPMAMGTPIMLARYLLISEVSEMYMRAFAPYGFNPWFRLGEGNKGEGLSRFLAEQFLLRTYPGVAGLPSLMATGWNCTNSWLNSVRKDFLEVNDEDIAPGSPDVGGATLFLMYLHDQLGYSIVDIINAGGGHLSNVYENLTSDSWANAWGKFSKLVNDHYPTTPGTSGFAPGGYFPPLDTVFPVSDLTLFAAPTVATWITTGSSGLVVVGVDHPAVLSIPLVITSSHPTIIPASMPTIGSGMTTASVPLKVLPQPAGFKATKVTLTVSYAFRTLTRDITVVEPSSSTFEPLEIDVDQSVDPCAVALVAGTAQSFVVSNINVFPNQSGLKFAWSVNGATPMATNTPSLTIAVLPAPGTTVTISVTVTNAQGLSATGAYTFQTIAQPTGFQALEVELRCRLNRFRNGSLSIPPWVPIERAGEVQERLVALERQVQAASKSVAAMNRLINQMQEISRQHAVRAEPNGIRDSAKS
jgi:hypothetical protein